MRYTPIDSQLYIQNRQRLYQLLKPKSLVILHSNDVMPTNADGTMGFKQNSDLFYLSGIDQEETVLLVFPDHPDPKFREILFVRETNENIAIWEGEKLTIPQAFERSGIPRIYWTHQWDSVFPQVVFEAENVYFNTNEHARSDSRVQTRDARYLQEFKEKYPLHRLERLAPLMAFLRAIKQPLEIEQLQKAINITHDGFMRVLKFIKPDVWEYEIEAEFAHEFLRQRSLGFAYTPIIASGKDSCVLHYTANNKQCKDGDILLLDVAAEYGNYNADLTRTIPVNGRFSARQRQVYEAVLSVLKAARSMLVVGNVLDEYQAEVAKIMESELIDLGLLTPQDIANQHPDRPAYRRYFMHGTSHALGLDVHDVGNRYRRFAAGMVFTCEPGIYIREEGLGIRLENNILITENGNIDLMAHIPIEADEIEALMNS
jgi:Xaa-Pro aminopeptidase